MSKNILSEKDLNLAHELADLYYWMDVDCMMVNRFDKDRLYAAITKNNWIHARALQLVEERFQTKYGRRRK